MAIEKQIWVDVLMEGFYPDRSFLQRSVDMSALVEYNKINLAEAGVDPNVLIDNNVFPVPTAQRADSPLELALHTFDTENTVVRNIEEKELSYDKMASVIRSHKNALYAKTAHYAAHNWTPVSNAAKTPVLTLDLSGLTTGSEKADAAYNKIVELKSKFDSAEFPVEGRRLVLSTELENTLLLDRNRFGNLLANLNTGEVAPMIAGFEIYSYVANPYYTSAGAKKAFGSIPGETDKRASVAFVSTNIAKKTGMTKQYYSPAASDPENQTNKLNYRHYFIACPAKSEQIGAILL